MVTAQERYSRTIADISQSRKQKEAQRIVEEEYYKTPEGQQYQAYQQRIEKINKAIEEMKAIPSRLSIEGYTEQVNPDGTITYSAPQETVGSERSGYVNYSPDVYKFKNGMLISQQKYAAHTYKRQTTTELVYNKELADPTNYTYRERDYRIEGYATKLQSDKLVDITGKVYSSERWKPKDYDKPAPRDYTTQEFYKKYNPQQKAAYEKSQMAKGIYTPEQIAKASKLTNEAQIEEFGRVIRPTIAGTPTIRYSMTTEKGVVPISKTQYEQFKKEEKEYKKIQPTKQQIPVTFLGTKEERYEQYKRKGYSEAEAKRLSEIEVTTLASPEVAAKMEKAQRDVEVKNLLTGMDIIAAGGVPSEYRKLTPRPVWVEQYEQGIIRIGEKFGIERDRAVVVSDIITGGLVGLQTVPKETIPSAKTIVREARELGFVGSVKELGAGVKDVASFIGKGVVGIPKVIYEVQQKQRVKGIELFEKAFGKPRETKFSISVPKPILQKVERVMIPTPEEKVAAYTVGGLILLGVAAPPVAAIVGYGIVGGQAIRTIKEPTLRNVGTLATFIAAPFAKKGIQKGYSYLQPKVSYVYAKVTGRTKLVGAKPARVAPETTLGKIKARYERGSTIGEREAARTIYMKRTGIDLGKPSLIGRLAPIETKATQILRAKEVKALQIEKVRYQQVYEAQKGLRSVTSLRGWQRKKYFELEGIKKITEPTGVFAKDLLLTPSSKKFIPATKILTPYEARTLRIEAVKKGIIPIKKLSARERRIVRKGIIAVDLRYKKPISAYDIITKDIIERPAPLTPTASKWFLRKELKELRLLETRKRIRPISSLSARERRIVRKGIIAVDLRYKKPEPYLAFSKEYKKIPLEYPQKVFKKDIISTIYPKRKITTIKDIAKLTQKPIEPTTTSGRQLLVLEKPKLKTKTILEPPRKKVITALSPYAYGGQKYEVSNLLGKYYLASKQSFAVGRWKKLGAILSGKTKVGQRFFPILLTSGRLASAQKQEPLSISISRKALNIKQKQLQESAQAQAQISLLGLSSTQVSAQIELLDEAMMQEKISGLKQEQKLKQKLKLEEELIGVFEFPKERKRFELGKIQELKQTGYDVLIKRKQLKLAKGKYKSKGFVKANTEPLTREAALGLGASIVDTYANKSYTIRKAKGIARRRIDLENQWVNLKYKMRQAKRNANIIVEKDAFAIDTEQERNAIPYEAQRLLRQKRIALLTLQRGVKARKEAKYSQLLFIKQKKSKRKAKKGYKWF